MSILALLICSIGNALAGIDYIGQALDLSSLANGTSTEVVIRAAGNDANDASYGFVYYDGSTRFKIDNTIATKDALRAIDNFNAYTFVLEKTAEGRIRVRENVKTGYIPYYSGSSRGGFSSVAANNSFAGYFTYAPASSAVNTLDTNPAYVLTAALENGLSVNKSNNEFQVGGSSVTLTLQFFKYASADKYANFPALKTYLPPLACLVHLHGEYLLACSGETDIEIDDEEDTNLADKSNRRTSIWE